MMTECDNDTPIERAVSHEDAVSISTSNLVLSLLEYVLFHATVP